MNGYRDQLMGKMNQTTVDPSKVVPVEIPEWGVVYVRTLSVADVERQTEAALKGGQKRLADSAARVICDGEGKQVFDPNNEEDITFLSKQPWKLMQKILQEPDNEVVRAAEGK